MNEMWWIEFVEAWAGGTECYCEEIDEPGAVCAPCQFAAIRKAIEEAQREATAREMWL